MLIKSLALGAGVAVCLALGACSGEQEAPVASTTPADAAVVAATTAPAYEPAAQRTAPVSPQLSTPAMDNAVSHATSKLMVAQQRCDKVDISIRPACNRQAQAFYEASVDKVRSRQ